MTHPLHPMVVHFPIALLSTAVFFGVLEAVTRRDFFRQVSTWLLSLGVIAAAAAVVTGGLQEEVVEEAGVPEHAIEQHETLAFATLAAFVLLLAMRALRGRRWIPSHPAVLLAVGLVGLVLLGFTGYYGGELVYKYGAGVEPVATPAERDDP